MHGSSPTRAASDLGARASAPPAVSVRGVWKIFGDRADEALALARDQGVSKAEILERTGCVVGVADASFDVRVGEIFCVMGLSGSGKSTLARHVNRLLEPTAGRILIQGEDVLALDDAALRRLRNRRVAMVFQSFGLLPHRSVRDNVAMPLEIRGAGKAKRWETADRALEMVELTGWEDKFAHELSGGMQQRVGLARAIACDADILLMDEPFSALDPLIRRQLQDQFLALSQQLRKTTLFITHDLDEAIRLGDRIAIMKDGRIVQIGAPEEIVMRPVDAYVADFVAGISKLNLVSARSVMTPIDDPAARPAPADGVATAPADATLNQLIDLSAQGQSVISIVEDGRTAGVVTRAEIIEAIRDHRGGDPAGETP